MEESKSKAFKQRLFRVHTTVGIVFSLLMYVSVFFGLFTIFLPYVQVWEKPSRHFEISENKTIEYSKILEKVISNPEYPKNNIYLELPGYLNDPSFRITHRFMKGEYFNPYTKDKLVLKDDTFALAKFLNGLHYGEPLKDIGYKIFGLMAVAGMFLIIGGLLLIYYLKFQNNGKNQQSTFSKWHRKILTFTFLPFLLVILTGALMCVGYSSASYMTKILTKGKEDNIFKITNPILKPALKPIKLSNEEATMLPIKQLINKAKSVNPELTIHYIQLLNWKDKTAQVEVSGYNPYKPFLNGVYNRPKVILSAVDGSVIKNVKVMDKTWSVLLADFLYFLHLLSGVDILIRVLMVIIMLSICFALGFGVMLYLEKKAKKFDGKIPFYHWLGKLSLAVMIGVIPSTALLFNLQWALPFDLENRVLIQKSIFFNFWLATLTWSFYRINSYKAAKQFLSLGGCLFITASFVHIFVSGFSFISMYQKSMYIILGVDVSLVLLGIALLVISSKLPKNRDEAKFFWNKKYKIK